MTQPARGGGGAVADDRRLGADPAATDGSVAGRGAPQKAANTAHDVVLEVDGLGKVFRQGFFRRETIAVHSVSLSVERGEVFGFLGPNGAGKTTTIKMLMGLLHPTRGRARLLGLPAGDLRAKARVGYLPENPYFYDYLSASEYLHMVGRIYGLQGAVRRRRVEELLERLGLGMAKDRAMRSYSKGMMQRVGLAQAIVGEPDLVVLDEPMSGLDPIGRREVRELIASLREAGKTVFFSTHILSDAETLCDRVGIIVKGQMKHIGKLGELLSPIAHAVEVVWQADEATKTELRREFSAKHEHTSEGEVSEFVGQGDADAFIAALVHRSGRLVRVSPQRQTLEQMFMEDASGAPEELRS